MKFNTYKIEDGDYECHGCRTRFHLKAFCLPHLCNQPLVLCDECQQKMKETLRKEK